MKKLILTSTAIIALAACAETSYLKEQSELYKVSMTQYQDYSCQQVRAEMRRLSNLIQQQVVTTEEKGNEILSTALAAFAISRGMGMSSGESEESAVLMRLKSQYNALDQLAIQKSCLEEANSKK